MPIIYEVLGYPFDDKSDTVCNSRRKGHCPYTNSVCDGGGNRYQSAINLNEEKHSDLANYFDDLPTVQSGVCSIQVKDGENPWIVCPRRLFYLGEHADQKKFDELTQYELVNLCGYKEGDKIGVWWETKVQYSENLASGKTVDFNYTFDYVLMPLKNVSLQEAASETGLSQDKTLNLLRKGGYSVEDKEGTLFIKNFPLGAPTIVEVMTSSTSGGNKEKRTCIPQAFEDYFINNGEHTAPGINYRQVWARMASQLIVKSQAAMQWGGRTICVLQDLLANYISSSTALNLKNFESAELSDVNILVYSYKTPGKPTCQSGDLLPLTKVTLYSGQIQPNAARNTPSFQDIVLASVCPPKNVLIKALLKKGIENEFEYSYIDFPKSNNS